MQGIMIFQRHGQTLFRFEFPLDDKERIGEFIHLGYDELRRAHPGLSLFDDVIVAFDKA